LRYNAYQRRNATSGGSALRGWTALDFTSFEDLYGEACLVLRSGRMLGPAYFFPDPIVEGRKARIAHGLQLDPRDHQPIRFVHYLPIDLGSPDHGNLVRLPSQCITARHGERGFDTWRNDNAGRAETRIAAHNDIGPAGKGLANRSICLSTHDYGLSYCDLAEMPQV
jgi:hypothetical protein